MLDVCGIGQGHTWGLRVRLYQWALFEIVNFLCSFYLFICAFYSMFKFCSSLLVSRYRN